MAGRKQKALETRQILAERFPLVFKGFYEPKIPLKIGIDADLFKAAPDLSKTKIKIALRDYADGPTYHRALVPGAMRVDLTGAAVEAVTPNHAEHHKQRCEAITKARAAHKAATAEKQPGGS